MKKSTTLSSKKGIKNKVGKTRVPREFAGGGITLKALSAAAFAGALIIGASPAEAGQASLISDVNSLSFKKGIATGFAAPASQYTIVESTSADYNYKSDIVNADGTTTTHYYKITLNTSNLSTTGNISWQEVASAGADTIAVKLPNNQTKYLKYTYTTPSGYTTATVNYYYPTSNTFYNGLETVYDETQDDDDRRGDDLRVTVHGTDQATDNSLVSGSSSANASASADATSHNDADASIEETAKGGATSRVDVSMSALKADFKGNKISQTVHGGHAYGGQSYSYGANAEAEAGTAEYTSEQTSNFSSSSTSPAASADATASADAFSYADAEAQGTAHAFGGAIAIEGRGSSIEGNFVQNKSESYAYGGYAEGGIAHAEGGSARAIGGIATADVTVNKEEVHATRYDVNASASVYASATVTVSADAAGSVEANTDAKSYAHGGAISNQGRLDDVSGDFVENRAYAYAKGGTSVAGTFELTDGTTNASSGSASASAIVNATIKQTSADDSPSVTATNSASASADVLNQDTDSPSKVYEYPSWYEGRSYWASADADAYADTRESNPTQTSYNDTYARSDAYAYGGAVYNTRLN